MKIAQTLIFTATLFGTSILSAGPKSPLKDCETVAGDASALAVADPSSAASVAKKAVAERPDCACAIVKEVIKGAGVEDDSDAVVSIVKGAIEAADDQVTLISECAIAVSPNSSTAVVAFIDATYGRGTAATLGLAGRPNLGKTGIGNNFVIPPAYGGGGAGGTGGDAPTGGDTGGDEPTGGGGGTAGGGTGGGKPPVGTPGDPAP